MLEVSGSRAGEEAGTLTCDHAYPPCYILQVRVGFRRVARLSVRGVYEALEHVSRLSLMPWMVYLTGSANSPSS